MLTRSTPAAADRGSASIELVILFPAVLLLVTALVQYALWFHANSLALAAAQDGVSSARAYGAVPEEGQAAALAFIDRNGADTLLTATATASSSPTEVQVTVTGKSLSVLPGVAGLVVTRSATGPVERFVTEAQP